MLLSLVDVRPLCDVQHCVPGAGRSLAGCGGLSLPSCPELGTRHPPRGHRGEEDRAEELQFLRDGGLLWDQSRHKGLFKQLLSYTAL